MKLNLIFLLAVSSIISLGAMQPEQPIDPNQPLTGQKRKADDLVDANAKKAAVDFETLPFKLMPITDTLRNTHPSLNSPSFPDELWANILGYVFAEKDPFLWVKYFKSICIAQGRLGAGLLKDTAYNWHINNFLGVKFRRQPHLHYIAAHPNGANLNYVNIQAEAALNTPGSRANYCYALREKSTVREEQKYLFTHLINQISQCYSHSGSHDDRVNIQGVKKALADLKMFRPILLEMIKAGVIQKHECLDISPTLMAQQIYLSLGIPVYELPGPNADRKTYLEHAVLTNNFALLNLYMKHGAKLDTRDSEQNTLLHRALSQMTTTTQFADGSLEFRLPGNTQMLQLLTFHGIDLTAKNNNNHTPYDCAQVYCNQIQTHINKLITDSITLGQSIEKLRMVDRTHMSKIKRNRLDREIRTDEETTLTLKSIINMLYTQLDGWQPILELLNPKSALHAFVNEGKQCQQEFLREQIKKREEEAAQRAAELAIDQREVFASNAPANSSFEEERLKAYQFCNSVLN